MYQSNLLICNRYFYHNKKPRDRENLRLQNPKHPANTSIQCWNSINFNFPRFKFKQKTLFLQKQYSLQTEYSSQCKDQFRRVLLEFITHPCAFPSWYLYAQQKNTRKLGHIAFIEFLCVANLNFLIPHPNQPTRRSQRQFIFICE